MNLYKSIFLLLLLSAPSVLFAVGDAFTIGVNVSSDATPPTIPAPVTVTPVTATQIDVAWGASFDNEVLAGYKLFRDTVQIATTTLTNYNDTGLTPSTTYAYYVQAYDEVGNVSTSSVIVSTTTPATPAGTSSSSGSEVDAKGVSLLPTIARVIVSDTTATLFFDTNTYSRYVLRWGKSGSFELGSVQNEVFRKSHQTTLTHLEPGTRYQFEIVGITKTGQTKQLQTSSFVTSATHVNLEVPNVSFFQATPTQAGVSLHWQLPIFSSFQKVRVVRNYHNFPSDPSAGYIAYEGTANNFFDDTAWVTQQRQYYTIFVYDTSQNISSGAITIATAPSNVNVTNDLHSEIDTKKNDDLHLASPIFISTTSSSQDKTSVVHFKNLQFTQNAQRLDINFSDVTAVDSSPITIALPAYYVTDDLKRIIVTVTADDMNQSFLMRRSADGTAYEAVIPALTARRYQLMLVVDNYVLQTQWSIEGSLTVIKDDYVDKVIFSKLWLYVCLTSLLLLVWWLHRKYVRIKK